MYLLKKLNIDYESDAVWWLYLEPAPCASSIYIPLSIQDAFTQPQYRGVQNKYSKSSMNW